MTNGKLDGNVVVALPITGGTPAAVAAGIASALALLADVAEVRERVAEVAVTKAAAAARQARADDATAQPPPRMATVAETLADETIASVQETAAGQTAADVSVDCGPPPQLLRDATVDSVVSVVGSTGARMCCACTCVACSYGNACIFGRRAGISDIEDLDELEMSVQNSAEPVVTMV